MRVFIDIGGFKGHSALAALDPIFGFDRVFCIEPVPEMAEVIRKIKDPRLVVVQAALSDKTGQADFYGGGELGASLLSDYGPAQNGRHSEVKEVDAALFLSTLISSSDFVRMKLNCEGAEVFIIESLCQSGLEKYLNSALVDFDAARMPSMIARVQAIKALLSSRSVRYYLPEEAQYGWITNYGGIRSYLILSGAALKTPIRLARSFLYNARMFLNSELNGYHKKRILDALPWLRYFVAKSKQGNNGANSDA
jgi:FkbM family methyltransferase